MHCFLHTFSFVSEENPFDIDDKLMEVDENKEERKMDQRKVEMRRQMSNKKDR